MIDDDELRALFEAESEEHLQQLERGLLRLEHTPDDRATLEATFREAHSLKGAARTLDVVEVEMLAHAIEGLLSAASKGGRDFTPAQIDQLCAAVSATRKLVAEALTGVPADVDIGALTAALRVVGEAPAYPVPVESPPAAAAAPSPGFSMVPAAAESLPVFEAEPALPAGGEDRSPARAGGRDYRIETVRVTTRQLDGLLVQAGELMVTGARVGRRSREVDELIAFWEDWQRELQALSFVPGHAAGAAAREAASAALEHSRSRLVKLGTHLARLRNDCYEDGNRLHAVADRLDHGVRAMRMLPLTTILNGFPMMVREIARDVGKEVGMSVSGGEVEADKHVLERIKNPLMHLIRNAIDHGIEPPAERERLGKPRSGSICIECSQTSDGVLIDVYDDGRGIDLEGIRRTALKQGLHSAEALAEMSPQHLLSLIFLSRFSTRSFVTDVSGRGVGLDVVRSNVDALKGSVEVDSTPGRGTRFHIRIPTSLATTRILLAAVAGQVCGVPVDAIERSLRVERAALFSVEGQMALALDGEAVSVAPLADLLELERPQAPGWVSCGTAPTAGETLVCVLIRSGEDRVGLLVDDVVGEQEAVVKPPGALLRRVRNVSGAAILGTGQICVVLNPQDLIKSLCTKRVAAQAKVDETSATRAARRPLVLLAEDSITTRTQEKRILEGAGYAVLTAVDGLDAWSQLTLRPVDAVVSDIEMPNLDGLALTARIRRDKRYAELPVVLVTTLAGPEDRRRGLEAGASAYIAKSAFDQSTLVETLQRLL